MFFMFLVQKNRRGAMASVNDMDAGAMASGKKAARKTKPATKLRLLAVNGQAHRVSLLPRLDKGGHSNGGWHLRALGTEGLGRV